MSLRTLLFFVIANTFSVIANASFRHCEHLFRHCELYEAIYCQHEIASLRSQ